MIRFNYLTQIHPPAPFVTLTIRNPVTGAELRDVAAQIDTAADRTLLPDNFAQTLSLAQIGSIALAGVGGIILNFPSHLVELALDGDRSHLIEVVASPGENWILLGRDVVNDLRLLLDGPHQFVEID